MCIGFPVPVHPAPAAPASSSALEPSLESGSSLSAARWFNCAEVGGTLAEVLNPNRKFDVDPIHRVLMFLPLLYACTVQDAVLPSQLSQDLYVLCS